MLIPNPAGSHSLAKVMPSLHERYSESHSRDEGVAPTAYLKSRQPGEKRAAMFGHADFAHPAVP